MRKQLAAVAALCALALPASAQATATITFPGTDPIPGPGGAPSVLDNMFAPELAGLGMTVFASTGADIVLDIAHLIKFEFLGSESGYSDTFTAGSVTHTELTAHVPGENHFAAPIFLGYEAFGPGSLSGLLNFTTTDAEGDPATVGDSGFAIFLSERFQSGGVLNEGDSFYIGYDDKITGDDNHDDFLVKATLLSAVPEPSTWLLMILGFGAIGFGMRQRKQTERIRFNFA
jgi:hypothetical protein